jgi:hypothetical protein
MSATQAITLDRSLDSLDPAELQAAARDAYRQALAHGPVPTGAELGHQFGRSDRWGRDRIAEARTQDDTTAARAAADPPSDGNDPAATANPTAASGSHAPTAPEASGSRNGRAAATETAGTLVAATEPGAGSHPGDPAALWSRRLIRWVTTAAVIIVAACAARSSYEHQRTLIEMAGERDSAWYLPLSVDGLVLIASLNMLVRRWEGQPAGWLTWTALLLGGAASLAANIAAAEPTLTGRLVAAWSPICLTISYELLMQQLPARRGDKG